MDKNAIKKYAVWARRELIERVSQRAMLYGITANDTGDPDTESVNGHLLSQTEKKQRQALIHNIQEKGYTQVMEEVAYTWFNRFAALRFMEVNGYLPSHIRVFTNDAGEFKPQILAEAIHLELDGLDMNKVYELESANKSEELFKYLLIVQCNALNSILPGMFQRIEDYTELLLPDYLLREGSVIEQMVTAIPEEDWTDQVQIIGWLYQYYNTEPKDKVFTDLKKNIKITKENIPAATQQFTPDWIVHYMVENSLGRLWLEGHPNDGLKAEWKYYLDEAEQEPEVQAQLAAIRKEYAALKPEEIRVIDPCMGSGHILCVLFDVLVRIYEDYGYTAREAAVKIVENNLWGLDIDERAAQLSYFAVMMKARQYDRCFFTRQVQPHVYAIEESNGITSAPMHDMGLNLLPEEYDEAVKQATRLVEEMHDAKEYGSIIHVTPCDWELLRRFAVPREEAGQLHLDINGAYEVSDSLQSLINLGETLSQKYHIVVTNPPYMGAGNMNCKLSEYVRANYQDSKTDLFACFIERGNKMITDTGFNSMVTMQSWMFLTTLEKMRSTVLKKNDIVSLMHMENMVMGIAFGTAATVFRKEHIGGYKGTYNFIKLSDIVNEQPRTFPVFNNRYAQISTDSFSMIPGTPVAYWLSKDIINVFTHSQLMKKIGSPKEGITTGNNDATLRFWFEVERSVECLKSDDNDNNKWRAMYKGGDYRRWYGNMEYVVLWGEDGSLLEQAPGSVLRSKQFYGSPAVWWTYITSGRFSSRLAESHILHNTKGPACYLPSELVRYTLGLFNSKVMDLFMDILAPTIAKKPGDVANIPFIYDMSRKSEIEEIVEQNIHLSKEDWDYYETSWEFQRHPLLRTVTTIKEAYSQWNIECESRHQSLKTNEEELNRIFIDVYCLSNELTPEVEDKEITVHRADLQRDIRSFISYAVGCMFGRYTLGDPGLIYAGGEWDASQYTRFRPDKDAIIPICDDEYFEDDVVGRFVKFVEVAFGKETLEENLCFIGDALGGKGSSREVIRSYFINDFYADHLKVYQKRPIYWLFDSGKKNGFKCLIYMHRYQPDTIARIRTDYVHEQQSRYRTAITDLEQRIDGASTSERVRLSKQLATLQAQAEEIRLYEEKIHHLADQMIKIDLDDGVKVNYAKFEDVLAKIK